MGVLTIIALAGVAGCSAGGATRHSDAGRTQSWQERAWDFNGDGKADLAVGRANVDDDDDSAGRVDVLYGSADGLPSAPVTLTDDPGEDARLDPAEVGTGGAREPGFGASLASADFNRDGYGDLAVLENSGGYDCGPGRILILYGGLGLSRPPTVITGELAGASLSCAQMIAADFNDDGWADLALSTWQDGPLILRGGRGGFLRHGLVTFHVPLQEGLGFPVYATSPLAAGDVDGDDHQDLVVVASGRQRDSIQLVYVGGTATGPLKPRTLAETSPTEIVVADLNDDGFDEVIAGIPGKQPLDQAQSNLGAGEVVVFQGGPYGPGPGVRISQSSPGVPGDAQNGDLFGASLAVADVDLDQHQELMIGAPGGDIGTVRDAGILTVLRWMATGPASRGNHLLTQQSPGVPGDVAEDHRFASRLVTLDITGDGQPEVIAIDPGVVAILEPLGSSHASGLVKLRD